MLILASRSPRRTEILDLLQLKFKCIPSDIKEDSIQCEKVSEISETLAYNKAQDVFLKNRGDVIIGADTVVTLGNTVFGKPTDAADAKRMLKLLSDKTHIVYTGVAIVSENKTVRFTSENYVTFYPIDEKEIDEYIASGEPFDKAGAYAIQGLGAKFVKSLQGDFYSVMGLPAARLYNELKLFEYSEDC